jgi:hypothetical protein
VQPDCSGVDGDCAGASCGSVQTQFDAECAVTHLSRGWEAAERNDQTLRRYSRTRPRRRSAGAKGALILDTVWRRGQSSDATLNPRAFRSKHRPCVEVYRARAHRLNRPKAFHPESAASGSRFHVWCINLATLRADISSESPSARTSATTCFDLKKHPSPHLVLRRRRRPGVSDRDKRIGERSIYLSNTQFREQHRCEICARMAKPPPVNLLRRSACIGTL